MHSPIFGFHGEVLGGPLIVAGMTLGPDGVPKPIEPEKVGKADTVHRHGPYRYYAFAVSPKGGSPRVYEFDNSEEGLKGMADLIRTERVLRVVLGSSVQFDSSSVVDFNVDGTVLTNRLPVPD